MLQWNGRDGERGIYDIHTQPALLLIFLSSFYKTGYRVESWGDDTVGILADYNIVREIYTQLLLIGMRLYANLVRISHVYKSRSSLTAVMTHVTHVASKPYPPMFPAEPMIMRHLFLVPLIVGRSAMCGVDGLHVPACGWTIH